MPGPHTSPTGGGKGTNQYATKPKTTTTYTPPPSLQQAAAAAETAAADPFAQPQSMSAKVDADHIAKHGHPHFDGEPSGYGSDEPDAQALADAEDALGKLADAPADAPKDLSPGRQARHDAIGSTREARKLLASSSGLTADEKKAKLVAAHAAVDAAHERIVDAQIHSDADSIGKDDGWVKPKTNQILEDAGRTPKALRKAAERYLRSAEDRLQGRDGMTDQDKADNLAVAARRTKQARGLLTEAFSFQPKK